MGLSKKIEEIIEGTGNRTIKMGLCSMPAAGIDLVTGNLFDWWDIDIASGSGLYGGLSDNGYSFGASLVGFGASLAPNAMEYINDQNFIKAGAGIGIKTLVYASSFAIGKYLKKFK